MFDRINLPYLSKKLYLPKAIIVLPQSLNLKMECIPCQLSFVALALRISDCIDDIQGCTLTFILKHANIRSLNIIVLRYRYE